RSKNRASVLCNPKIRNARVYGQLRRFCRIVLIGALNGGHISPKLLVHVGAEQDVDEVVDAIRKRAHDERQYGGVPEGEACSNARERRLHPTASPNTNPIPRTVCRILRSYGSSILRRSRATMTSITLSSGVARGPAFQTSRANISLDTT